MRTRKLAGLVFLGAALGLVALPERSAQAEPQVSASACSGYTGPICKISGNRSYYYKTGG